MANVFLKVVQATSRQAVSSGSVAHATENGPSGGDRGAVRAEHARPEGSRDLHGESGFLQQTFAMCKIHQIAPSMPAHLQRTRSPGPASLLVERVRPAVRYTVTSLAGCWLGRVCRTCPGDEQQSFTCVEVVGFVDCVKQQLDRHDVAVVWLSCLAFENDRLCVLGRAAVPRGSMRLALPAGLLLPTSTNDCSSKVPISRPGGAPFGPFYRVTIATPTASTTEAACHPEHTSRTSSISTHALIHS